MRIDPRGVLLLHGAFLVSIVLCLVAAGFSLVRSKKNRRGQKLVRAPGD
ncbi:MAG TPA: hypothetical protein VE136_13725 [Anaerolineales bacterium]|nr:hypothetical protein [Anaerolineales bacterium]